MNQKRLGWTVAITSIVAISLLIVFQYQIQQQNALACAKICGAAYDADQCVYHNSNSWPLIVTSILTAFIGGIGFYLAFAKGEKIIHEKEYDLTKLSHQEKDIFLLIKDHHEGIYQSELVTKFNLSKVRITRILDKLEQLGHIERKRRGMTNIVVVK